MPDASKPSHGHRYTYPSRRWQKHPLTGGQTLRRTARLSCAFQKAVLAPLQPRDSRVAVRCGTETKKSDAPGGRRAVEYARRRGE